MFDVDWCTHSFHSIPFHSIPFHSIHSFIHFFHSFLSFILSFTSFIHVFRSCLSFMSFIHVFHSFTFHSIPFHSIHFQYSSVQFSSIQLSSIQSVILSLHSVIRFKTPHLNSSVFTRFTRSIQTISCHSFSQLLASILFNSVSLNSSIHSCSFNFWGCSTSLWVIQAGPDNAKPSFLIGAFFPIFTFFFETSAPASCGHYRYRWYLI